MLGKKSRELRIRPCSPKCVGLWSVWICNQYTTSV